MGTTLADRPVVADRQQHTLSLWEEYRDAGTARRRELETEIIKTNLPLAKSLANRYTGRGIPSEDLVQVACLGLVKAVRGFDPERGDFVGYAVPTIRGELRRHFRDIGWTIRPPRRVQELQPRLWAAEEELTQSLHRPPTVAEISAALGVDQEEVIEGLSLRGCFTPGSLDAGFGTDDSPSPADRLGAEDPEIGRVEVRMLLSDALERLDERERTIVRRRFFDGWTQAQIGAELGVTQVQISRLLTQILATLRAGIDEAA